MTNAEHRTAYQLETRALRVSMYSAFAMALVGIGFAYAANSQAILLDGLFNLLLFFMLKLLLGTHLGIQVAAIMLGLLHILWDIE